MARGRLLDRTSDEYRLIAGLISSAHRTVGATDSQWWNHRIGVLPRLSRIRSQVELDGTISLHPRHVIAALQRNGAGDLQASRDASYEVVRQALRLAGPAEVKRTPDQPLDQALPVNERDLDQALTAYRAAEITQHAMAQNAMPYLGTPFEPTTHTVAVRGLVDRLAEACDRPRDGVADELLRSPKHGRWIAAIAIVAESERPGLLDAMEAEGLDLDLMEEHRAAGRQWARLGAARPVTSPAAETSAYQIGRDTGGLLVVAGKGAADTGAAEFEELEAFESPVEEAAVREPSPAEVLGAQAPPGTASSGAVSGAAATHNAERTDKHLGL
ncbi:MAG TPA: hypothetical protein VG497_33905 [Kribbella sp.]|nr:hypothetical protein [Kribbella sp.]